MKKVLFLIHDLGRGGAEKVLINLVNNMDRSRFDITVTVLFGGGVNEQLLSPDIHLRKVFPRMIPGNSKWMKLLTPAQLHRLCVKDSCDVEISYLEGPSARVISGCGDKNTRLIGWIHSNHFSMKEVSASFRNKKEMQDCYTKFHQIVCVSQFVKSNFSQWVPCEEKCQVLYNTVESDTIIKQSGEEITDIEFSMDTVNIITMGTLKQVKGYERLFQIIERLKDQQYPVKLYILGDGPLRKDYENYINSHGLQNDIILLGYRLNPYKYISRCDLYVCSSYSEGFSTAVTEALILGIPVCTVEVSGMKELLGADNEYGIVTMNDIDSLYQGIKELLDRREMLEAYRILAKERGSFFNTEHTVREVEKMIDTLES